MINIQNRQADIQYRDMPIMPVAPPEGEPEPDGIIQGLAIVFDKETELIPGIFEKIDSGAVDNALLRGDDVRALFNHDPNYVLGRVTAGNIRLWKEAAGLRFEIQIDPEITWQRDLWRQVKAGIINQCSFGFRIDSEKKQDKDGEIHYTILDITLYDISVVTFPAYSDTVAEARSRAAASGSEAEKAGSTENNIAAYETELALL